MVRVSFGVDGGVVLALGAIERVEFATVVRVLAPGVDKRVGLVTMGGEGEIISVGAGRAVTFALGVIVACIVAQALTP